MSVQPSLNGSQPSPENLPPLAASSIPAGSITALPAPYPKHWPKNAARLWLHSTLLQCHICSVC